MLVILVRDRSLVDAAERREEELLLMQKLHRLVPEQELNSMVFGMQ
jgi:hypothetical protein